MALFLFCSQDVPAEKWLTWTVNFLSVSWEGSIKQVLAVGNGVCASCMHAFSFSAAFLVFFFLAVGI